MVKCQGQRFKYQQRDLITRNTYVKYQTLALTIQMFKQGKSIQK